jgi:hypothetical protein
MILIKILVILVEEVTQYFWEEKHTVQLKLAFLLYLEHKQSFNYLVYIYSKLLYAISPPWDSSPLICFLD